MWKPITLKSLLDLINHTEQLLDIESLRFWQLIKIEPVKWSEQEYGEEGSGFWVIAICGNKVIWYNDIEDGFNISLYETYGQITKYGCEQYEFNHIIYQLYHSH